MTTEQLTTAAHEAYQNLPSGHIAREAWGQIVFTEAFKAGVEWALKQEGLPVGEVSERSEQFYCWESGEAGVENPLCEKQCDHCAKLYPKQ